MTIQVIEPQVFFLTLRITLAGKPPATVVDYYTVLKGSRPLGCILMLLSLLVPCNHTETPKWKDTLALRSRWNTIGQMELDRDKYARKVRVFSI